MVVSTMAFPYIVRADFGAMTVSRIDESTLLAMQQHVAQQVAFAQIPDVVKRVSRSSCCCNLPV